MLGVLRCMILLGAHAQDTRDPSERFATPDWQRNPCGPAATRALDGGRLPPIVMSPAMTRRDRGEQAVLRDGDIVFRAGDARAPDGVSPISRILAGASGTVRLTASAGTLRGIGVMEDICSDEYQFSSPDRRTALLDLALIARLADLVSHDEIVVAGRSLDRLRPGNSPDRFFLADRRHAGTPAHARFVQVSIIAVNARFGTEIEPLRDAEILGLVDDPLAGAGRLVAPVEGPIPEDLP